MSEAISICCDLFISVLFFTSFYSKIGKVEGFQYEIYSYRVVRSMKLTQWASYCVLAMECALFLCFATGLLDGIKEVTCILIMIGFSIFTIRKRKITGVTTCACFGEMKWLNRFPISRNVFIILVLLLDLFVTRRTDVLISANLVILTVSLGLLMELIRIKVLERGYRHDDMVKFF